MQFAPGDVIAVTTHTVRAFVQVTHRHVAYPEVVRALDWRGSGTVSAGELAEAKTRFTAMFPLGAAIESGRIRGVKIGTAAVPQSAKNFPTFKVPILDKKDGLRSEVAYWWLWDGDELRYAAKPDVDMNDVPMREVMSTEHFLERLAA